MRVFTGDEEVPNVGSYVFTLESLESYTLTEDLAQLTKDKKTERVWRQKDPDFGPLADLISLQVLEEQVAEAVPKRQKQKNAKDPDAWKPRRPPGAPSSSASTRSTAGGAGEAGGAESGDEMSAWGGSRN